MAEEKYIPRLLKQFNEVIKSEVGKTLNISNTMRIPKVEKIILNMGMGDARENKNHVIQAVEELTTISGQQAVKTFAKKAISNFKIREADPVGVRVTIRRERMYEFLDRFISVTSPRIRDFQGLPAKGFDGRGNYNFGLSEQIVFPEINYDKVNKIRGMNVTIVTSAQTDEEAYELLLALGLPIRVKKKNQVEQEVAA
jgi:large subunit ribosomal protein L5